MFDSGTQALGCIVTPLLQYKNKTPTVMVNYTKHFRTLLDNISITIGPDIEFFADLVRD
jgi:hypothetical protein